jgi:hypothetical protein
MIGVFFNLVIPGPVSGDAVKMIFTGKQVKEKKTEAALTILLDRAIGMFALLIFAIILVLYYLPLLNSLKQGYRFTQMAIFMVGLLSVFSVFGISVLMLRPTLMRRAWITRIIQYGAEKLPKPIVSTLNHLIDSLKVYRNNLSTIVIAIFLSFLIHLCLGISLFFVGLSIGENVLRMSDYLLATQISNVASILPLTPGGIGLRDAGIAIILRALNAPAEKAVVIPIIMTFIILFWRLSGGLFFIFSRTQTRMVQKANDVHIKDVAKLGCEAK